MLPDKNGVYLAQPTALAIEEKATGTAQVNVSLKLVEYRGQDGKGAEPCDAQITAYMNIVKKDGTFNEINLRAISESLGWATADGLSALQNLDLSDVEVQAVISDGKDQNGNSRKEVRYLNPRDYAGSPSLKSDPAVATSLDAKYGSKLRALAIKPSAAKSNGAAAKPANASADLSKQAAWVKYTSIIDEYGRTTPGDAYSQSERTEVFKKLAQNFGSAIGKTTQTMDAADWANLEKSIAKEFSPATRDICPF